MVLANAYPRQAVLFGAATFLSNSLRAVRGYSRCLLVLVLSQNLPGYGSAFLWRFAGRLKLGHLSIGWKFHRKRFFSLLAPRWLRCFGRFYQVPRFLLRDIHVIFCRRPWILSHVDKPLTELRVVARGNWFRGRMSERKSEHVLRMEKTALIPFYTFPLGQSCLSFIICPAHESHSPNKAIGYRQQHAQSQSMHSCGNRRMILLKNYKAARLALNEKCNPNPSIEISNLGNQSRRTNRPQLLSALTL